MYGMQRDMTGSAVALAILELAIRLNLPYEVHAFLGVTENLISHKAYKPSDVVVASNGTSIEVTDTDAEGRMVLSDVLSIAQKEGGDLMLDFGTLTGAVIRALDMRRSGIFTNQMKLLSTAYKCGEECGERVWGFPIGEDYAEQLKSDVADILQCRVAPEADHIYAATFLSHFAGEKIPWVHMDLSAAECTGGLGLVSSNTTGFGVRWALTFAREVLGG
jgi:leucyl aminopeptidase